MRLMPTTRNSAAQRLRKIELFDCKWALPFPRVRLRPAPRLRSYLDEPAMSNDWQMSKLQSRGLPSRSSDFRRFRSASRTAGLKSRDRGQAVENDNRPNNRSWRQSRRWSIHRFPHNPVLCRRPACTQTANSVQSEPWMFPDLCVPDWKTARSGRALLAGLLNRR